MFSPQFSLGEWCLIPIWQWYLFKLTFLIVYLLTKESHGLPWECLLCAHIPPPSPGWGNPVSLSFVREAIGISWSVRYFAYASRWKEIFNAKVRGFWVASLNNSPSPPFTWACFLIRTGFLRHSAVLICTWSFFQDFWLEVKILNPSPCVSRWVLKKINGF